jgi:hypothetical protein
MPWYNTGPVFTLTTVPFAATRKAVVRKYPLWVRNLIVMSSESEANALEQFYNEEKTKIIRKEFLYTTLYSISFSQTRGL